MMNITINDSDKFTRVIFGVGISLFMLGVIASPIMEKILGNRLMVATFTIFGFRKVSFDIGFMSYIYAAVIICGVALLTAAVKGRRIKRLEPVKMITEE